MIVQLFIPNLVPSQLFPCKITRTCVPLMVVRFGLHRDATSMYFIDHSMAVAYNIAGIESHYELEELYSVHPRAECPCLCWASYAPGLHGDSAADRVRPSLSLRPPPS
jgi:hypothetical protein